MFPIGLSYKLYEQYIFSRPYLVTGLKGVAGQSSRSLNSLISIGLFLAAGVACASLLFLFNPLLTIILMVVICMTVTCVYGLLAPFGLLVNGVTVVNIIMGVSVSSLLSVSDASLIRSVSRLSSHPTSLAHS